MDPRSMMMVEGTSATGMQVINHAERSWNTSDLQQEPPKVIGITQEKAVEINDSTTVFLGSSADEMLPGCPFQSGLPWSLEQVEVMEVDGVSYSVVEEQIDPEGNITNYTVFGVDRSGCDNIEMRTEPVPGGVNIEARADSVPGGNSIEARTDPMSGGVNIEVRTDPMSGGVNIEASTEPVPGGVNTDDGSEPMPAGENVEASTEPVSRGDNIKVRTEPLSAYSFFIKEHKDKVDNKSKLNMPELNKRWSLFTESEKEPYEIKSKQDKQMLIENGTYRLGRKKRKTKSAAKNITSSSKQSKNKALILPGGDNIQARAEPMSVAVNIDVGTEPLSGGDNIDASSEPVSGGDKSPELSKESTLEMETSDSPSLSHSLNELKEIDEKYEEKQKVLVEEKIKLAKVKNKVNSKIKDNLELDKEIAYYELKCKTLKKNLGL